MLNYIRDKWIAERDSYDHKCVIVTNRIVFRDVVDLLKPLDDIAYISIESTEDCANYYHFENNSHYLESADNVLNLEFDDLEEDAHLYDCTFRTISEEQAEQILDFIERNMGKHFVIHCRAGKSRSQGVLRFIFDMYGDVYAPCQVNGFNPCMTPNGEVVRKLKRAYYKRYGMFDN